MRTNTKLKLISLMLAVLLMVPVFAGTSVATDKATLDVATYTIGVAPASVKMTFYKDILSRGFAWYTSEDNDETLLWVAEGILGEGDDFESAAEGASTAWQPKTEGSSSVLWDPDMPDTRIRAHQAYVENLSPNTVYSYKLGGNGEFVYGTFVTDSLDTESVTILNVSDAQTRDPDKLYCWENTIKAAVDNIGASNIDFVAFGGDLYDDNMKAEGFSRYYRHGITIDTVSKYIGNIPFMHTAGNHDVDVDMMYKYSNTVNFAGLGEDGETGYYSFDYGSVHYVSIGYYSSPRSDEFKALVAWLDADLKAAKDSDKTKWIIVSTHWGFHTTGDHGNDSTALALANQLAPVLSANHVDLVIQGHDHTFVKTFPYKWDHEKGFAPRAKDVEGVVIQEPASVLVGETEYYIGNEGTVYVSPGAAGHRVGENEKYAKPGGLYTKNPAKTIVDSVNVSSSYASVGTEATGDFDRQMYGVLNVDGDVLKYDFYVVEVDGSSVLVDTLRLYKGTEADAEAADAYYEELGALTSSSVNDDKLAELAEGYGKLTDSQKELVDGNLTATLKSLVFGVTSIDAGSARVALTTVGQTYTYAENGTKALFLAAEMNGDSTSCGFIIKAYAGGETYEIKHECTEAYTKTVSGALANVQTGISGKYASVTVGEGKLGFALTVTEVPTDGTVMEITPYCTDNSGKTVTGNTVAVRYENGVFAVID